MRTVVVLGGYGNFGKRIADDLAGIPDLVLVIAGRNLGKASKRCREIKTSAAKLIPCGIDIDSDEFESRLIEMAPFLVINASGPFQNQNYHIPKACINVGCHYVDLADDRRFVCDIGSLNRDAMGKKVLIVSGASSVPGLSSVVLDNLRGNYTRIDSIDIAIAPGNRAERGTAHRSAASPSRCPDTGDRSRLRPCCRCGIASTAAGDGRSARRAAAD